MIGVIDLIIILWISVIFIGILIFLFYNPKYNYLENTFEDEDIKIIKRVIDRLFKKYKMFKNTKMVIEDNIIYIIFYYDTVPEVEYLFRITKERKFYNFEALAIDKRHSYIFNDDYYKIYEEKKVAKCFNELDYYLDAQIKGIYFAIINIK